MGLAYTLKAQRRCTVFIIVYKVGFRGSADEDLNCNVDICKALSICALCLVLPKVYADILPVSVVGKI